MPESIAFAEARRIALAAQGFASPKPRGRIDRRHLQKTMKRLGLLQLDSVPVVIRTQYLPGFSRLGPYRADLLDEVAYPTKKQADHIWFEAWSHEASLLPVEMEPWLRWSKRRASEGNTWPGLYRIAEEKPEYVKSVLDEVEKRGPLAAAELSDPGRRSNTGWGSHSAGSLALDWLFRIGELGIRRRPGFVKEFDLLERIVPSRIRDQPTPSMEESLDELLMLAAKAHGVGTADCLVDYFRLPVKPAKARLAGLVESGRLESCEVECWKKPGILFPGSSCPKEVDASALLSPFDPLVWRRKRIEGLFKFDYKLEIYTPAEKRRWGYYVLPFLMGDDLVARFDLKTNRDTGILEVRASHLEKGACLAEVAERAAKELASLAKFVRADSVKVMRRGKLAKALSQELGRFAREHTNELEGTE